MLSDNASVILDAVRHYQRIGKWFVTLFLIMPDHIHMLVHVAMARAAEDVGPYLPENNALYTRAGGESEFLVQYAETRTFVSMTALTFILHQPSRVLLPVAHVSLCGRRQFRHQSLP